MFFWIPEVRRDNYPVRQGVQGNSTPELQGHTAVDNLSNPKALRVRIKASKTDPFRRGVNVFVGRSSCPLCPVAAMIDYVVIRGPGPGPLFRFHDNKPLTRSRFVEQVKAALTKAGIDSSHYSGHSFRSGAATAAASKGINDSTIKMLGRWKSEAYQLYIKTPREQLAAVTSQLLQDESPTGKQRQRERKITTTSPTQWMFRSSHSCP